jgi:dihydropteroate synthase
MNSAKDSKLVYDAGLKAPPYSQSTWLRPVVTPFGRQSLSGGHVNFDLIDVVMPSLANGYVACRMSCEQLLESADDRNLASAALDRVVAARPDFAGLQMDRIHLMGVLNVTPDSFFDGGVNLSPARAIQTGKAMWADGASIIDIGGESTRPGAAPVTLNQELARILPSITGLVRDNIRISVDTRHAEVMTRATEVGASIINDISGLQGDGALAAAAASKAPVVIMHMQGTPETMQKSPSYDFAPIDIYESLNKRINAAIDAGIPASAIAVDPGFGFGKSVRHNLQLVNWLSLFQGLGVVVLFGASRKSTIAKLSKEEPAKDRLPGSLALATAAWRQGVHIIRVHDVAETAQALTIELALRDADCQSRRLFHS